jgi:hypothetical protein
MTDRDPRIARLVAELRERLVLQADEEADARTYLASQAYDDALASAWRRLRALVSGGGPLTSERALYTLGQIAQLVHALDAPHRAVDAAAELREKIRKLESGAERPA